MHAAAVHVLPILASEKSKFAFYIFGGALAIWAVVVSVVLGLRMPDFPRNATGQRIVIAITAILVIGAASSAVLTSGVPAEAGGVKAVTGSESATTTPSSPAAVGSAPQNKATSSTLALAADPSGQLRYDQTQLKAPAGRVTITFTNASQVPHNVTVATQSGSVIGHTPTGSGKYKLALTLRPGSYVYYCSVQGHRQAGMQGTLIVS